MFPADVLPVELLVLLEIRKTNDLLYGEFHVRRMEPPRSIV